MITITMATTIYPKKNYGISKMAEFLTKCIVAIGDICLRVFVFQKLVRVMINLYQTFLSSNSDCNYYRDYWLQTELDSTRSYYHYKSKV